MDGSCVRGSPLIRFFLLTLALLATAAGLARLTATTNRGPKAASGETPPIPATRADLREVAYRLKLSAPAAEIKMNSGPTFRSELSGSLSLDPANPYVEVLIRWKEAPPEGEYRFAKLTLVEAGKPETNHVFEASGDIDDLLELSLSTPGK